MSENWKTIVAQGALALVLGVVIVAIPDLSEKVVRYLLGGFLVVYAMLLGLLLLSLGMGARGAGTYGSVVNSRFRGMSDSKGRKGGI